MSFSKRKPYSKLGMSLKAFFNAPVRHLKDLVTVESALEKPYRWDYDYPAMHIEFPPFPDWELEPWHPWDDGPQSPTEPNPPDDEGPQPEPCLGCAIVCRAPYPECSEDPIWCHAGIWCGNDLQCNLCSWEVLDGNTFVEASWKDGKNFYVKIDTEKLEDEAESGEATFFICMTDPLGHVCCDEVEIDCDVCDCDTAETLAWSSAPPETLTEGGGWSTISVTGGCGPYTFSLSDGGYDCGGTTNWSLLTSGPISSGANSISIVATASCCCLVTVTDACGSTVEQLVKNARGSWKIVDNSKWECEMPGPATWRTLSAGVDYFEYIEDEYMQLAAGIYRGGGTDPGDCCSNPDKCTGYDSDNCLELPYPFRDGVHEVDTLPCWCTNPSTGQYSCWEMLHGNPFEGLFKWGC